MNRDGKNLVFSSVGDSSKHKDFWLRNREEKEFDLALYYYGDSHLRYKEDADIYFQRKGSKWQNLSHFCRYFPKTVLKYDAIFVTDDDLEMDGADIDKIFSVFHQYDLWLAQPALTEDSDIHYPILKRRQGNILRYVNFVECGFVIFSKYSFERVKPAFFDILTGSGSDYLFPCLLGMPKDKIAVIDSVSCRHPYRESEISRFIPRYLCRYEERKIYRKYHAQSFPQREYGRI